MMAALDRFRTDAAYVERLRLAGLGSVDEILRRVDGTVVAWSRTTDTVHIPGAGAEPGFFVKRYYFQTWRKRLRGMFRGTFFGAHRAAAEAAALRAMQAAGVPAVRPVAIGARRMLRFLTAGILVTEAVPDAVNLTTFFQRCAAGAVQLTAAERRTWTIDLAGHVARLHAEAGSHGQLYFRNILVRRGWAGTPEFFFLDAQPLRRIERVGAKRPWWVRELAQLAASAQPFISRSDGLRFLRHYLRAPRVNAALRGHVREIVALARRMARHETQRVRMSRLFLQWQAQLDAESAAEVRR